MLYDLIKIFHIVSAAFVLTSMAYSVYLWQFFSLQEVRQRIQFQTVFFVLPFFFLQLFSGFALISLRYHQFSRIFLQGSVISFMVMIASWFGFIYLLSAKVSRQWQFLMLSLCVIALLSMIFFMANKVVFQQELLVF